MLVWCANSQANCLRYHTFSPIIAISTSISQWHRWDCYHSQRVVVTLHCWRCHRGNTCFRHMHAHRPFCVFRTTLEASFFEECTHRPMQRHKTHNPERYFCTANSLYSVQPPAIVHGPTPSDRSRDGPVAHFKRVRIVQFSILLQYLAHCLLTLR